MPTSLQMFSGPLRWMNSGSKPLHRHTCLAKPASLASTTAAPFSTSPAVRAGRKKGRGDKPDPRVRAIRYHLSHPLILTPRPLRLSRLRSLRHWTIHRAWHLFLAKQRREQEVALERQYNSMRDACEALRVIGEDGLAVAPDAGSARTVRPPGARDPQAVSVLVGAKGTRLGKIVAPRWAEQGKEAAPDAAAGEDTVELDLGAAAAAQADVGRLYRVAMEKKGVATGAPIEYSRLQTDTPSKAGWDHEWQRASLAGINTR